MRGFANLAFSGRLTHDPEDCTTTNGTPAIRFSVVVNRSYKNGDSWEEKPMYFRVRMWGAKIATEHTGNTRISMLLRELKKGDIAIGTGELNIDRVPATADRPERTYVDVKADARTFEFVRGPRNGEAASPKKYDRPPPAAREPGSDDLPF